MGGLSVSHNSLPARGSRPGPPRAARSLRSVLVRLFARESHVTTTRPHFKRYSPPSSIPARPSSEFLMASANFRLAGRLCHANLIRHVPRREPQQRLSVLALIRLERVAPFAQILRLQPSPDVRGRRTILLSDPARRARAEDDVTFRSATARRPTMVTADGGRTWVNGARGGVARWLRARHRRNWSEGRRTPRVESLVYSRKQDNRRGMRVSLMEPRRSASADTLWSRFHA